MGFCGLNVTVPHKEAAFALAHDVDEAARIAGAVNLLVFEQDRIVGRNTDAPGLGASLRATLGPNALVGRPCSVLGAGGAARAVVLALARLGAGEIRIANRSRHRAETLVAAMSNIGPRLTVVNWNDAFTEAALLVNATSAGMTGKGSLDISLQSLPADAAVCDIVYNPLETEFLKMAKATGHKTVDGLGMLMHQAVPSFAAFFGVTPQVTPALRAHLEQALHG
jgi:shikimate dehydrogenase